MKDKTDSEICSILNLGYNGNPKRWFEAKAEAERRGIYFIKPTKKHWYKFW